MSIGSLLETERFCSLERNVFVWNLGHPRNRNDLAVWRPPCAWKPLCVVRTQFKIRCPSCWYTERCFLQRVLGWSTRYVYKYIMYNVSYILFNIYIYNYQLKCNISYIISKHNWSCFSEGEREREKDTQWRVLRLQMFAMHVCICVRFHIHPCLWRILVNPSKLHQQRCLLWCVPLTEC